MGVGGLRQSAGRDGITEDQILEIGPFISFRGGRIREYKNRTEDERQNMSERSR